MKKTKRNRSAASDARISRGRTREEALFPVPPPCAGLPEDYGALLSEIKQRIGKSRIKTVMAAHSAMVMLYWDIGRLILDRQAQQGWGAKVIDRLASDLRIAFPDMTGLSPRNLKYMRAFAAAWPDGDIVQQIAAQIPWFHNCLLLDRISDAPIRLWYVKATIEHGWSRNLLAQMIDGCKGGPWSNIPGAKAASEA